MSGEELDKKLKNAGYVLADVARLLGVPPQSINQTLNAKDVKSGFIEDLCRVLDKDISFFYSVKPEGVMEGKFEELRKLAISNDNQLDSGSKRVNGWMNEADVIERIKLASKRFPIEAPAGIDKGHLLVNTVLRIINSYPNLSAEWLMTGTGEMLLPVVGANVNEEIVSLKAKNEELQKELARLESIKFPTKDSKVYNLWMKFMDITSEMQELYKEEKGE